MVAGPVTIGQTADRNPLRTGSVDEFSASDIYAYMGDACGVCILEEYKVTWLQIVFRNKGSLLILGLGGAVKCDTVLLEYILHKPGTIKTAGSASTPYIRNADVFLRCCNDGGGFSASVGSDVITAVFQRCGADRCMPLRG